MSFLAQTLRQLTQYLGLNILFFKFVIHVYDHSGLFIGDSIDWGVFLLGATSGGGESDWVGGECG